MLQSFSIGLFGAQLSLIRETLQPSDVLRQVELSSLVFFRKYRSLSQCSEFFVFRDNFTLERGNLSWKLNDRDLHRIALDGIAEKKWKSLFGEN